MAMGFNKYESEINKQTPNCIKCGSNVLHCNQEGKHISPISKDLFQDRAY